jgi:B12-binding domain/radical SAM domain protein
MKSNLGLVLYYTKLNRYSFNALVGALETDPHFDGLPIYFIQEKDELIHGLEPILKIHEKVVVALSFFTTQLWDVSAIMRTLSDRHGDGPLYLAGGPHPTGDPQGTLAMGFDVVVLGEGEETLIEILKKIDANEDYTTTAGIVLNDSGGYRFTGQRSHFDLSKYPSIAPKHAKFGPIEVTRGCPYTCHYCQTPHITGRQPRHRSIEDIVDQVGLMKSRNLGDIRFTSPNAFSYGSKDGKKLNMNQFEALLQRVKRTLEPDGRLFVGTFPSEVRPEHVTQYALDLIKDYADNDNLTIGAQSGSQRILDLCRRDHTVGDVYRAIDLMARAGLSANVDFIFGLPHENVKDIGKTVEVMRDLAAMGARIHAHTFMPLPRTSFAKAPPGRVPDALKKWIHKATTKGTHFGDWSSQGKIAERIANYLSTGKL